MSMINQQMNNPFIVRRRRQFVFQLHYRRELRYAYGNSKQDVAERLALITPARHFDEHGKLGDRRYDESDHSGKKEKKEKGEGIARCKGAGGEKKHREIRAEFPKLTFRCWRTVPNNIAPYPGLNHASLPRLVRLDVAGRGCTAERDGKTERPRQFHVISRRQKHEG